MQNGYENIEANVTLYFGNYTRYSHSYSGRRIGTPMRSIEWCHFQCDPNLFKVRILTFSDHQGELVSSVLLLSLCVYLTSNDSKIEKNRDIGLLTRADGRHIENRFWP